MKLNKIEPKYISKSNPRIGLITLATDFRIEKDFNNVLNGKDIDLYCNRIHCYNPLTNETLKKMADDITNVTKDILPDQKLDCVAYGCTSGTIAAGYNLIVEKVNAAKPNTKVTTPITAATKALKKLNINKISIFTPYTNEINNSVVEYFKNENFEKVSLLKKNKVFEIKNIKNSLKITYPQIVGFKADQEKLSDVRDVIESFYFYDVKKSLDSYPDNLPTLSYVTKDGMILSISSLSPDSKGESWVIIKAESNNPKSKKLAEEIRNKTSGFQFLANINTSNILRWEASDLRAQKVKN